MTTEELLMRLREAENEGEEEGHFNADNAIVTWFRSHGHNDVADAFEKLPKWYA